MLVDTIFVLENFLIELKIKIFINWRRQEPRCLLLCSCRSVYFTSEQAFEDYRDADDAVHDLNNKDLLGERYSICN